MESHTEIMVFFLKNFPGYLEFLYVELSLYCNCPISAIPQWVSLILNWVNWNLSTFGILTVKSLLLYWELTSERRTKSHGPIPLAKHWIPFLLHLSLFYCSLSLSTLTALKSLCSHSSNIHIPKPKNDITHKLYKLKVSPFILSLFLSLSFNF